ncbi:DNA-binding barrel domain superfamily [Sesbania bispinosa]|nr:DNA-binding barrel domain superfamily [Sesbania bispinosa]
MGQFYDLHHRIHLDYTYVGNGDFSIRLVRPNSEGEIHYPQPTQQEDLQPLSNDPEEVMGVSGRILWTALLTKAQLQGRQGLVVTVRIVTGFLEYDQQFIKSKLPNGEVKPWIMLWNTKIDNHCRLGQGWYQYCREERLNEGDELMFWKLDGEDFIRLVL